MPRVGNAPLGGSRLHCAFNSEFKALITPSGRSAAHRTHSAAPRPGRWLKRILRRACAGCSNRFARAPCYSFSALDPSSNRVSLSGAAISPAAFCYFPAQAINIKFKARTSASSSGRARKLALPTQDALMDSSRLPAAAARATALTVSFHLDFTATSRRCRHRVRPA